MQNNNNFQSKADLAHKTILNFLKQKKTIAGIFAVFGILILFLGFTQIKNKIYKPFDYLNKNNSNQDLSLQSNVNLEDLKKKDTDKDGLSDYDELYIYYTSPYLKDSDSDGILDKAEIEAKTDPNCPVGKICDKSGIFQSPTIGGEKTQEGIVEPPALNASSNLSIEEIKQMLLKNGVSQEQLNQLDDQTIRKAYEETVKTTGIDPTKITPNYSSNSEIPLTVTGTNETLNLGNNPIDLQGMSVEQMRQYLLQSGMDETTLKQVDDETLKTLFQKAASEAGNE